MPAETWHPVPGHHGRHEVSDRGRVRTTADGSSGVSVTSLLWLLLIAAVAVMVYKAELVNSIANGLALALCSVPVGWALRWAWGEIRLEGECRHYAAQDARRARPARLAITSRAPLAIEAARVVTPLVIEHEGMRMER